MQAHNNNSEYYANRSGQTGAGWGKGKGNGGSGQQPPMTQQPEVVESDKFQVLDYEADVQVSYKIQKVRIYVATTWTFPVNPSTIVTDQGTYEEELNNGFYWTTGVRSFADGYDLMSILNSVLHWRILL
jgi:hypothetical protein